MQDILGMISLTTAASLLLILAAIWLIVLIVKRQHEYVFRAMLIILLLLLGLIFLRQHEAGRLTLPDLKMKIFPGDKPVYHYYVERERVGDRERIRYVFLEPKPKLSFKLEGRGTRFVVDVKPLNEVLKFLELPPVAEGVPELSTITWSNKDINLYRWEDYPEGILTIEKTLCQNRDTLEAYLCLANIAILSR